MTKKNRKGNLRKSVERENLMPDDYTDELSPSTSQRSDSPSQYNLSVSKKAQKQLERKSNWQDDFDHTYEDELDSEEPSDVYDSDGENVIMTRRKTDLVSDRKLSQLQSMMQTSSPTNNVKSRISKKQNSKAKSKPGNSDILKKSEQTDDDDDDEEEEEEREDRAMTKESERSDVANNIFAAIKSTEDLSHIPDDYNDLANMGWHPVLKWGFTLAFWGLVIWIYISTDKMTEHERLEKIQDAYLWFYKYASTTGGIVMALGGLYGAGKQLRGRSSARSAETEEPTR